MNGSNLVLKMEIMIEFGKNLHIMRVKNKRQLNIE